ncbi:NAD(P)/FAD-dependent oxidoreductase [Brachybacterium paraconglomeratum]|uniref:NAD(P)/FAD-dependent oxidoreductase n=1 Tax=Brachybacterium paraconglomeratum TaxID=173362 RepID=UPI0037CAC322
MSSRVVVVGASASGLSTVERLRERGHRGSITLVGDEVHAPYDRPPLSKGLLSGAISVADLQLRAEDHLSGLGVDHRPGSRAVRLDAEARRVGLADGSSLPYDQLVIATGLRARRLPDSDDVEGVHVLRTREDAIAFRVELEHARRVVIIGGGFLASEVASVVTDLSRSTTIVSRSPLLMDRQIGSELAGQVTAAHRARGVDVLGGTGRAPQELLSADGRVRGVRLEDGTVLEADVVLLAIGGEPAVDWLEGSSVPVEDGVLCGVDCSAVDDVYAVGDVARWHNELFETQMRLEHRTNAVDQGRHVADRIIDRDRTPYAPVPYFWSDQLGLKFQSHGYLRAHDEVRILHGSVEERRLVALYRRGDRLVGAVGVGAVKALRGWRSAVAERARWVDVMAAV